MFLYRLSPCIVTGIQTHKLFRTTLLTPNFPLRRTRPARQARVQGLEQGARGPQVGEAGQRRWRPHHRLHCGEEGPGHRQVGEGCRGKDNILSFLVALKGVQKDPYVTVISLSYPST